MPIILSYPLPSTPMAVNIEMPVGAQVLTAQMQNGMLQAIAIVDPTAPIELRKFAIISTGNSFTDGDIDIVSYVNTVQTLQGAMHVFDITPPSPPMIMDPVLPRENDLA